MSIFDLPNAESVARHFRRALLDATRHETPYRRWSLTDVLPEAVGVALISLPIVPLRIDDCHGVRDTDNGKRTFFTASLQAAFPVCALLAQALQRADVAHLMGRTCGFEAAGSHLRMEYMQDTDGAWLEPHRDIPEKLCSMVIYLCTGPHAKDWGTDIYDDERRWIGRSSGDFNTGTIFVAGPNTWHGFEKRKIEGIRRLMEINYVHPSWRDRDQLSFPQQPIPAL